MSYNVTKIQTPDGVYFTVRQDDRSPKQVVSDGKQGWSNGQRSPIYKSLNDHEVCLVNNLAKGLSKEEATKLKDAYILVFRSQGYAVLN